MTFPCHPAAGGSGSASTFTRTALANVSHGTAYTVNVSTSSVAVASGGLLVAAACQIANSGALFNASISDTLGLTWTQQVQTTFLGDGSYMSAALLTAPVPSGGSTVITLANSQSQYFIGLGVWQYQGQNASPIGVSGTAAMSIPGTATPGLTLSGAPVSTSEVIALLMASTEGGNSVSGSVGTGWTELLNNQATTYSGMEVMARKGSTSNAVNWGKSMTMYSYAAAALEIKSA